MIDNHYNLARPRAVAGSAIRANANDPKAVLASLTSAFEDFKERYNSRVDRIEAAIDDQAARAAFTLLEGRPGEGSDPIFSAPDPDYSRLMAEYVLNGADGEERKIREANTQGNRALVNAQLTTTSSTSGGYLAPVEWDRQISKAQAEHSPMRRLARIQVTEAGAYSTLWSDDRWGSGWVGEEASRPATATPELNPIIIPAGEIYANAAATQRILDDAAMNISAWLVDQVEMMFSLQEGIAFIHGTGVNKPAGLLTFVAGGVNEGVHPGGNITVDTKAISHDSLIDFSYGLRSPYRPNSTWLMNSATAATISKLKDEEGRPVWRESLLPGQPAQLLGRPVELDENMPDPVTGNLAIAFGDFRAGYCINDRIGLRLIRDPYTNKPYVHFYMTKRVGGGLLDPQAIRLLKVS